MTLSISHHLAKLMLVTLACCLCILFASSVPAFAGDLKLTPSLRERFTWNDNFFLKGIDGIELRSEPALAADYSTDTSQLRASGRLSNFVYSDESTYNRTTYAADATASHQFSELLSATLRGGWGRDYSLDTYWDVQDARFSTMLRRDNYNAGVSTTYKLSELDTFELSFNWAQLEYEKRVVNYSDYDMLNTSLYWQHAMLDGKLAFIAYGSWQHLVFDSPDTGFTKQDITQDVWQAMAGLNWSPAENFSIQAMAGANRTNSEIENIFFGVSKTTTKENSTGFTGSLDVKWSMDNLTLRAKYEQEHLPSAYGQIRVVNTGSIFGAYNYSKHLSFFSTLRYSNSKSDLSSRDQKISKDVWYYTLNGRYRFTEDFSAILQYSYMNYNDKGNPSNNRESSNAVFLQFAYELPLNF